MHSIFDIIHSRVINMLSRRYHFSIREIKFHLIQVQSCPIIAICLHSCHYQLTNHTSPLFWQFSLLFFIHKCLYKFFGFLLSRSKQFKEKTPCYYCIFSKATSQYLNHVVVQNTSEYTLTEERGESTMDFQRHTAAVSLQTRIRLLSTPVQDHYLLVFSSLQTTLSFSDSSFMIYQAEILPRLPRAFFKWAVLFHSLPNITITFSF